MAAMALGAVCGMNGCKAQNNDMKSVEANEFEQAILEPGVFLLDVRTPQEYAEGHIAGAINADVRADGFMDNIAGILPKDMKAAVYCRTGNRSKTAAEQLVRAGYQVIELNTGITGWTEAGKAVTQDEADAFLTTSGRSVRMYCIKHGSVRMNIDGKWLYVDPVGRGAQPVTDYSVLPKADVILITHEHGDHLDADAINQLSKDGTLIIANPNSQKQLGKGETMVPGDTRTLDGGLAIKAVPAYNSTQGRENFHPKGRDNGYLISIDGFTVYVAGDTEDIPELSELSDLNIDVAFLPCNQPYTMTPEQLKSAAMTIGPKVLFPYHYGNTDMNQVTGQLEDSGIDVRIRRYQ